MTIWWPLFCRGASRKGRLCARPRRRNSFYSVSSAKGWVAWRWSGGCQSQVYCRPWTSHGSLHCWTLYCSRRHQYLSSVRIYCWVPHRSVNYQSNLLLHFSFVSSKFVQAKIRVLTVLLLIFMNVGIEDLEEI